VAWQADKAKRMAPLFHNAGNAVWCVVQRGGSEAWLPISVASVERQRTISFEYGTTTLSPKYRFKDCEYSQARNSTCLTPIGTADLFRSSESESSYSVLL